MKTVRWMALLLPLCFAVAAAAAGSGPQCGAPGLTGPAPTAQAQTLETLRQAIFAPDPATPSTIANAKGDLLPRPRSLDSCSQFESHPCVYWVCECDMTCGTCGVQTDHCNPFVCTCNPPC